MTHDLSIPGTNPSIAFHAPFGLLVLGTTVQGLCLPGHCGPNEKLGLLEKSLLRADVSGRKLREMRESQLLSGRHGLSAWDPTWGWHSGVGHSCPGVPRSPRCVGSSQPSSNAVGEKSPPPGVLFLWPMVDCLCSSGNCRVINFTASTLGR